MNAPHCSPLGNSGLAPAGPARVAVFGEALVDKLPGGPVPGGAPLNVARHLAGLGLEPLLISRVGQDGEGELLRAALVRWGLSTAGLQLDPGRPTGTADVQVSDGAASFEIPLDRAFDAVEPETAAEAERAWGAAFVYFGTLGVRSGPARDALLAVLAAVPGDRILDLNLRPPHYDAARIRFCLERSTVVKANAEELLETVRLLGVSSASRPLPAAQSLVRVFGLALLAVTFGRRQRCLLVTGDGFSDQIEAPRSRRLAGDGDPVGCGDAFTAALLAGRIAGQLLPANAWRALRLASAISGIRGAVPQDNGFYRSFLFPEEVPS